MIIKDINSQPNKFCAPNNKVLYEKLKNYKFEVPDFVKKHSMSFINISNFLWDISLYSKLLDNKFILKVSNSRTLVYLTVFSSAVAFALNFQKTLECKENIIRLNKLKTIFKKDMQPPSEKETLCKIISKRKNLFKKKMHSSKICIHEEQAFNRVTKKFNYYIYNLLCDLQQTNIAKLKCYKSLCLNSIINFISSALKIILNPFTHTLALYIKLLGYILDLYPYIKSKIFKQEYIVKKFGNSTSIDIGISQINSQSNSIENIHRKTEEHAKLIRYIVFNDDIDTNISEIERATGYTLSENLIKATSTKIKSFITHSKSCKSEKHEMLLIEHMSLNCFK